MALEQLDPVLKLDVLSFEGSLKEFYDRLYEAVDKARTSGDSETAHQLSRVEDMVDIDVPRSYKFMLFEGEDNGYLRLRDNREIHHFHIQDRFNRELSEQGKNPKEYQHKGGGDVKMERTDVKTRLTFYNASDAFGKFDDGLLKRILDENLNERIERDIR